MSRFAGVVMPLDTPRAMVPEPRPVVERPALEFRPKKYAVEYLDLAVIEDVGQELIWPGNGVWLADVADGTGAPLDDPYIEIAWDVRDGPRLPLRRGTRLLGMPYEKLYVFWPAAAAGTTGTLVVLKDFPGDGVDIGTI